MLRSLLIMSFLTVASSAEAESSQPNVLLLYLDNVGYGDLGCYGNKVARTPHIDRLAADGVRFTQWYCGSPSCSPSRGALLTGRHPERNGLNYQLLPEENLRGIGLPHSEKILPQYLKPLGYATACFGKWNIGFAPGSRPTERGFDEFLGHASGNIHYYKHLYHKQNDLRRGTEPVDLMGKYSTDLFADAAIDFIERNRGGPWFVYLPFNAVHFVSDVNCEAGERPDWQAPSEAYEKAGFKPDDPDPRHRFLAVLSALDTAVGRVLQKVDDAGLRERTLVLCISDNGAFMLPGRGDVEQSNKPLRDGGVTVYEGGLRVPAIIRWPGVVAFGTTCNTMLSSMDVVPSVVAAAGGTLPRDRLFDGRDARLAWQHMMVTPEKSEALWGHRGGTPHAKLWWVWGEQTAIRLHDWKMVLLRPDGREELYEFASDLGEQRNESFGDRDVPYNPQELIKSPGLRMSTKLQRLLSSERRAIQDDPTRSPSAREK